MLPYLLIAPKGHILAQVPQLTHLLESISHLPSFLIEITTYRHEKEIEDYAPIPNYRLKSFLIRCTVETPFPDSLAIVLML